MVLESDFWEGCFEVLAPRVLQSLLGGVVSLLWRYMVVCMYVFVGIYVSIYIYTSRRCLVIT